ncbi:Cenp-O kinetochore centromere component-domain-containing protein [Calycina marina]|uniref:Cenp-O kinetochore centromere component-domain-containing protein n=1 Tax=Calycina marina TaxID=1763456 RepID=A0A9P7YVT2_9HELO|nr:Cenp-O kinetochore centromere component-domain-containing protein [Calycina marina]
MSLAGTVINDPIGNQLDQEINTLQAQIDQLKSQRKLQAAAVLSSHNTKAILNRLRATKAPSSKNGQTIPSDTDPLLSSLSAQHNYNQENLYRACASITTFRVQDPDPKAVGGGKVLGVRIDVSSQGKFIRPYYIMLNKPYVESNLLRVHRHTVPPCMSLSTLAERYLPSPKLEAGIVKGKKQDLRRFVREFRKVAVAYHNRITAIKSLRKDFKLDEDLKRKNGKGKERERVIVDISAADAEANQVRIEWIDGRVGRCVVGDTGEVKKCVVIGEDGRDRDAERCITERNGRMELIAARLKDGIY